MSLTACLLYCKKRILSRAKKVLTKKESHGIISPALMSAPLARVVELVDSLASGASARKGVRVRLPPRAPKRKTRLMSCLSFWVSTACAVSTPRVISMLGRNEFALRQGFAAQNACDGAKAPPLCVGPDADTTLCRNKVHFAPVFFIVMQKEPPHQSANRAFSCLCYSSGDFSGPFRPIRAETA